MIPVGTLISLALLDSFPLEGGSLFAWGATTRRAYLRACRGRQAPRKKWEGRPLRMSRRISPLWPPSQKIFLPPP